MKTYAKLDKLFNEYSEYYDDRKFNYIIIDVDEEALGYNDVKLFTADYIKSFNGCWEDVGSSEFSTKNNGLSWDQVKNSTSEYFIGTALSGSNNVYGTSYYFNIREIDDSMIDNVLEFIARDSIRRLLTINKVASRIEIAPFESERYMTISDAKMFSFSYGEGWRLPTKYELMLIKERQKLKEVVMLIAFYHDYHEDYGPELEFNDDDLGTEDWYLYSNYNPYKKVDGYGSYCFLLTYGDDCDDEIWGNYEKHTDKYPVRLVRNIG